MSNQEILNTIVEELKSVENPRFADSMIDFYRQLTERFPEDGFIQILDDNDVTLEQEAAILQLQKYGYLERTLHGIGFGKVKHQINLRAQRYFEIANCQTPPTAVCMQDSGKRETFATGAVRDTAEGKPRLDLISPFATEKLAEWLTAGAKKYGPRNWEKGISLERHLQSLLRHLTKFQQGVEDGEDHLTAVFCNAMFMVHTREMVRRGVLPESLLDMPDYGVIPSCHGNGDDPLDY